MNEKNQAGDTPVAGPGQNPADYRKTLELRKLAADTERVELEAAKLRRTEADAASEASQALIYTFYSVVDEDSVRECMAELGKWSRRRPGEPITIIFNSPGGTVSDGLALVDYVRQLRQAGHHVTTIALGRAASMGGVLLQTGDKRVIGANAFMLIHEVSAGAFGKVSEMEDSVEYYKRLQTRLLAILSERSKLSARQIATRWARKDWWLDAQEVVKLGFADEVL